MRIQSSPMPHTGVNLPSNTNSNSDMNPTSILFQLFSAVASAVSQSSSLEGNANLLVSSPADTSSGDDLPDFSNIDFSQLAELFGMDASVSGYPNLVSSDMSETTDCKKQSDVDTSHQENRINGHHDHHHRHRTENNLSSENVRRGPRGRKQNNGEIPGLAFGLKKQQLKQILPQMVQNFMSQLSQKYQNQPTQTGLSTQETNVLNQLKANGLGVPQAIQYFSGLYQSLPAGSAQREAIQARLEMLQGLQQKTSLAYAIDTQDSAPSTHHRSGKSFIDYYIKQNAGREQYLGSPIQVSPGSSYLGSDDEA